MMIPEKERMKELCASVDISQFYVDGRVWHELSPREYEIVIKKSSYEAFYDSPLEATLKNMDKHTVIIFGTLESITTIHNTHHISSSLEVEG